MTILDRCKQITDTESGRVLLYRDEVEAVLTAGDTISRQTAVSLPVKPKEDRYFQTCNLDDAYEYGWSDLQGCIEQLPSAQTEIIRCCDCKEYSANYKRCRWWNHETNEAGWCYGAERREE